MKKIKSKWLIGAVVLVALVGGAAYYGNSQSQKGAIIFPPIGRSVVTDSYFNFVNNPDGGEPQAFFNVEFSRGMNTAHFQFVNAANRVVVATPHSCVNVGTTPTKKFTCQFHFLVDDAAGGYSDAPVGKYKVRVFYGAGNGISMTPAQITAQPHVDSPLVGYGL
jgi:hypothetical protein